jgi:hypothetical protein
VTVTDILAITDKIKNRDADQVALQTRNVLKRLFAYAIAREKTQFNPAAVEARFIAQAKSRDMALSPDEIGRLLRGIYQSNMRRAHKLALSRRLNRDYEINPQHAEAMIQLAMIHLLLKRPS